MGVRRRKQKSVDEEEDEDDDDDEKEEDDDKIEFDELEEPEESSDVETTSSNRTDLTALKSAVDGKLNDIETSRGAKPGLQPIGDKESMRTKVKVKKRNVMFRADINEFPEFDSEDDNKVTGGERKKKQKES